MKEYGKPKAMEKLGRKKIIPMYSTTVPMPLPLYLRLKAEARNMGKSFSAHVRAILEKRDEMIYD